MGAELRLFKVGVLHFVALEITSLLFELQTSVRGQNWVEFDQESNGHALLLTNERLNFARNDCGLRHVSNLLLHL